MDFSADAAVFLADFGEDLPVNGGPGTVRVIWDQPGSIAFRVMYGQGDDGLVDMTQPRATAVSGALSLDDTLLRGGQTYQVVRLMASIDGVFDTAHLMRLSGD
jgi:hypothetical protein